MAVSGATARRPPAARGFTLLELLVVLAIIAFATAGVALSMRDPAETRLEREASRLAALLESARGQSRASGVPVVWRSVPGGFVFDGLPPGALPERWLDPGTGTVSADPRLRLGPDPLIGRQEVALAVLARPDRILRVGTDGLRPFSVLSPVAPVTSGRRDAGFTLIEVLVAVAIVAIALIAGLQATSALVRNAQRQSDMVLAQLCAGNELTRVRLTRQLPGIGDNDTSCEQAGQNFRVHLSVRPTPNPSFRRVDASVDDGRYPIVRLSTVVGLY